MAWLGTSSQHVTVDIVVEVDKKNQKILDSCYAHHTDSDEELETHITQAFRAFDRDEDGLLGPDDFQVALQTLGVCLTDDEMEDFIRMADLDDDGKINLQEFQRMMSADSRHPSALIRRTPGEQERQHTSSSALTSRQKTSQQSSRRPSQQNTSQSSRGQTASAEHKLNRILAQKSDDDIRELNSGNENNDRSNTQEQRRRGVRGQTAESQVSWMSMQSNSDL